MNINYDINDNDNLIKPYQHQQQQEEYEHGSFKIKSYTGTSFLYSNWSFAFLLVVNLVAFGFFAQGLTIFYTYGSVYDWKIPALWFGTLFSTLVCIFMSMSLFSNRFKLIKTGLLLSIVSLIFTLLEITLLVIAKKEIIKDLQYCSEKEVPVSTCVSLFSQMFCGEYIPLECQYTSYGFKKMLLSQAAIALVHVFIVIFSFIKLAHEEKRKKHDYQPLSTE